MADETPEQQLLKLIEQPQVGGDAAAGQKTEAGGKPAPKKGLNLKSLMTPSGWKGVLSYAKEQSTTLAKQKPDLFSLRRFNEFFKFGIIGVGVLMALYIIYSAYQLNSEYHALSDFTQKQMADLPLSSGRMLDPNFFEDIARRNIFAPIEKKRPESQMMQEPSVSKAKLLEMAKDIKLTGISVNPADPSRTFCMIEDLQKSTTSFLKVGDGIAGFIVSKINQDSVELAYQKETIELR